MMVKTSPQLTNRKQVTPLTKAQKRRAAFDAILAPRKQSAFTTPINTGPLKVRRGTGINASH